MPGSRTYFGTDGVRGVVGEGLTEDVVRRLGFAFARWTDGASVLIGRDTRASGPAIEAALAEGLAAGGSKVTLGGVLPTPAVALLAEECGAVVSASHNPPEYNGVKLFAPGGRKLTDEEELEIEALFADPGSGPARRPLPTTRSPSATPTSWSNASALRWTAYGSPATRPTARSARSRRACSSGSARR